MQPLSFWRRFGEQAQIVGINRIARSNSHVLPQMNSLTASRCHINTDASNQPLSALTTEVLET